MPRNGVGCVQALVRALARPLLPCVEHDKRGATFSSAPTIHDAGQIRRSARLRDSAEEVTMADTGLTWTKERIELLTKLWTEGLSASQITAELGGSMSRNAVISKAHRLGLAHGTSKFASTPRARKPNRRPESSPTGETADQGGPALAPMSVRPQVAKEPEETRPR